MVWQVKRRKKVVNEISRCFLCNSLSGAQERVFIFGNSTHNFVEIIRSSLVFDISCCANSKLFICKSVVYKRLLKFERATEKVLELKREILESFQGRPRAKRLLPEMSVESKVKLPKSKTSRCRQRSERRPRKVFNLA